MNPFAPHKEKKNTRVVVAMSGGVDSSTVAAMMHEQGYETIGVTLQLYDHGAMLAKKGACCAGQDIQDARETCQKLGIPHYVLNYESRFRQEVMEEFADSYLRGETPIPCVRCNQTVKFRDLLAVAKDMEADALVTGHYVRRLESTEGAELHQAVDLSKDQSYFLFTTTREQLHHLHFPLGNMTKDVTRREAVRLGIPVADKPDSQDICFVPNGNYASVVEKLRPGAREKGKILHVDGTELGEHDGIIHFTRGQRRGLRLAWPTPLYVIRIEPGTNTVIVGSESALLENSLAIREVNWLGGSIPEDGLEVTVKLRSAHAGAGGRIYRGAGGREQGALEKIHHPSSTHRILLHTPERAITPGQAAVVYEGTRVLGGGWIC